MGQNFNPSFSAPDGLNPLSYLNPDTSAQVLSVRAVRAPTSNDRRYKLGTQWTDTSTDQVYSLVKVVSNAATWSILGPGASDVDTITGDAGGALSPTAGNMNILGGTGISTSGAGSTLTINASAGQAPTTEYVVDAGGGADYTTVQAAIDAANGAGGGQVFVRPGSYTEDLTLYDAVTVVGASEIDTIIAGTHTPPASGACAFFYLGFTDATAIFSSAVAGTAQIVVQYCTLTVTGGYSFNLANWTGQVDVGDISCLGTNDGFFTNAGGAALNCFESGIGAGTGNSLITTGAIDIQRCQVSCPYNPQTGTTFTLEGNLHLAQLNLDNDSAGTVRRCSFSTGATASIDMGSSGAVSLLDSVITSSASPSIAGAGAGTLTYENVAFSSNAVIAATLTTARGASVGGTARFTTFDTDVAAAASTLSAITWAADGTDAAIGLTITPKGTGTVTIAGVTTGTTVSVANAVNTVAQVVNVANGACAGDSTVNIQSGNSTSGTQTVNVGSGSRATVLSVGDGVGGNAITVGNGINTSAQTVSVSNGAAAADSTVNILSGIATAGTQTLNLAGGAYAKVVNVATGVAVANTITVGGTGANVITIGDTQTAGSISMGDAMTGGTITIGGSGAQTGALSIAPGTGAQTISVATSTGVKTIDVGTGAAANVITIGTTNTTAALNLDAGSGGISMTGDVDVDSGDLMITAAAKQLQVEGGAVTDFIGQATLVLGTVTVANTNIATTDRILVTRSSVAASTALGSFVTTISAATSFTIEAAQPGTPGSAETNDVSIVDYFIVRQL